MQFSNSYFGHGLFDPLIATFQGQILIWLGMLPKAHHTYMMGSFMFCPMRSAPHFNNMTTPIEFLLLVDDQFLHLYTDLLDYNLCNY